METVPVGGTEAITNEIQKRFIERWSDGQEHSIRMVVIVLARPHEKLARDEILIQMNYWNTVSGDHIDFFFVGWSTKKESDADYEISIPGHEPWFFNDERFHCTCQELKQQTKWEYTGGTELIITNSRFDRLFSKAELDFSSTICCRLERMLTDKSIPSVGNLFHKIFSYAEQQSGDDPTWGFSDSQGISAAAAALRAFLLSLLPEWLGGEYKKAVHFTIANVSRF